VLKVLRALRGPKRQQLQDLFNPAQSFGSSVAFKVLADEVAGLPIESSHHVKLVAKQEADFTITHYFQEGLLDLWLLHLQ
jgi:hypothetical protein